MLKKCSSRVDEVFFSEIKDKKVAVFIKREDALHPFISGNKFRKLKYNLRQAQKEHHDVLLTFGGAYSNHIAATAAAGKEFGFQTIGVIRGDELARKSVEELHKNPTLKFAASQGMKFHFVSRSAYRLKTEASFIQDLRTEFGSFYLVPEGGTNALAVKGCEEILTEDDSKYDVICAAMGTGGTLSGIINASKSHQKVLGFPSLKGDFLNNEVQQFVTKENWEINLDYSFGGYGKVTETLIHFINQFKKETGIPLDPIYTGKMLFGVMDLIKNDYFAEGTDILLIHTGGLQGIEGMNQLLIKKKLPIIQ
ncbi:MAG: 1-aminocyclopropane-1-carboxylate deaminase/D-cysteine desulfhydrase [Flavobacteriaceae bacterium]|nr:1-aminocyclopropane-1-carboxylate deaminase/D-cysteine desulfhydrase [Flavobacteriaceae bacterium]